MSLLHLSPYTHTRAHMYTHTRTLQVIHTLLWSTLTFFGPFFLWTWITMVTLKLCLNCWPLKVSWWKLSKCAGATNVRKWRISTTKHCYWPVVTVSGKDPTAYMLGISLKIRHRPLPPLHVILVASSVENGGRKGSGYERLACDGVGSDCFWWLCMPVQFTMWSVCVSGDVGTPHLCLCDPYINPSFHPL